MTLEAIRSGGKRAIARALSALDRSVLDADQAALLDDAFGHPQGRVVGLTGPPGVGKSTLTQSLIVQARARALSVAVVAVDPSSQKTGGSLLGDRARLVLDPDDDGVFVRSFAARDRLGGLSDHAISSSILLRALFDVVLVETVGIGQSDADVTLVADTNLLCVQPGSGDALQFMKAGIMEWPDIIAVTKADMGLVAVRAHADVEGALGLATVDGDGPQVLLISAKTGQGVESLLASLLAARPDARHDQGRRLVHDAIKHRFGAHGLSKLSDEPLEASPGPFSAIVAVSARLSG